MKKYFCLLLILLILLFPTTSQSTPTKTNRKVNIISIFNLINSIIGSGYEEKKNSYAAMDLTLSPQENEIHTLTDKAIVQKIAEAKDRASNFLLESLNRAETRNGEHETMEKQLKELPEGFPTDEIRKLLAENFETSEYKQIYPSNTEILLIRFFGLCELHKKADDLVKKNRDTKELIMNLYRTEYSDSSPTPEKVKEIDKSFYTDTDIYSIDKDTSDRLEEAFGTKFTDIETIKKEYKELKKMFTTSQETTGKATDLYEKIKNFQTFYAAAKNKPEDDRYNTETNNEYAYQDLLFEIDKNFPLHSE